jgi:2,3-bisphosphoglycerate-independent phosphoglycerate mutase
MLTSPNARGTAALANAVRGLYAQGQMDYSLEPIVLVDNLGLPIGQIRDGDSVVFCCRRGERETQLTETFTDPAFDRFPRPTLRDLNFTILTLYHEKFRGVPVAFAPTKIQDTLAEAISRAGLRQLHTAESEKFSHITFFFNGGNNQPFPGEEDIRVPSPCNVAFDKVPELSLPQVAAQVLTGIQERYDFIVTNFANGDVIGHSTNNAAKIRCASLVDNHLGQVVDAARAADYVVMITADHGNLELMKNPDGSPHVAHTTNPVPFLLLDPRAHCVSSVRDGRLSDIAPTILSALSIDIPSAMDVTTLSPRHNWAGQRRVLLVILDGWGIGHPDDTNPIFLAEPPCWGELLRHCPHSRLEAAGPAVGLEPGKAGNSEAGHMNIGAGRVILQDDVRLESAMQDRSFYENEILLRAIDNAKQQASALHLIGLLSDKSSHGCIDYPLAILRMAKQRGLERIYIHLIFDGRSTEPGSAPALLAKLDGQMQEIGIGQVASGIGRGIALDRDGDYEKTRRAFDAFVNGAGTRICIERGGLI